MTLGSAPTVVLVDDTVELRVLMRRALERRGEFQVVAEAGDGATGIEVAREHQPDLVLLDISMPVMNGLEALPQIVSACPGTKVVMLSAVHTPSSVREATEGGAAGYLRKGTPVGELLAELHGLLQAG